MGGASFSYPAKTARMTMPRHAPHGVLELSVTG